MTATVQKKLIQATDALKIVRLHIPAGATVPEHHANVDVVVTVVRGKGTFTLGSGEVPIQPGEVVVMPPMAPHSISAESDLELVVVHARLRQEGDAARCGA
jgi:quercetin dioxygenase-like cupin family protein